MVCFLLYLSVTLSNQKVTFVPYVQKFCGKIFSRTMVKGEASPIFGHANRRYKELISKEIYNDNDLLQRVVLQNT